MMMFMRRLFKIKVLQVFLGFSIIFIYYLWSLSLYSFDINEKSNEILCRDDIGKLYPFYILLFSVTNFIRLLPVIGQRYLFTVQIMSIFMFYKVFYPQKVSFSISYWEDGRSLFSLGGFIVVQVLI